MAVKMMEGNVTSPKGFKAASCAAEIKYKGREDMGMIYSEKSCAVAGTFTKNVVAAAPVIWDRDIVKKVGKAQAIIVNSGIANAATGQQGLDICKVTAEHAAEVMGLTATDILLGSTGVIGMQLDPERVNKGTDMMWTKLADTYEAGHAAELAMMTTDTLPKETAATVDVDGVTVTIGAQCKGSGMIHPNMCTMLCYITTDCDIEQTLLQEALSSVVGDTFNMISVDGDTSTNDTCLVLANGMAGNKKITSKDASYDAFVEALFEITKTLAKKMAGDGEGATALFEVVINGVDTVENAKILAKSVVCSSLVKAAIYGHDANWGRILCALGYSGVMFDPQKVDLTFSSDAGTIEIAKDGVAVNFSEEKATEILSAKEVTATCNMNMGTASATAWGCDLTYDYVKINADYRS